MVKRSTSAAGAVCVISLNLHMNRITLYMKQNLTISAYTQSMYSYVIIQRELILKSVYVWLNAVHLLHLYCVVKRSTSAASAVCVISLNLHMRVGLLCTGCLKINFTFLNVNNVRTNIRIATPVEYIDRRDL